jgi:hypothetical protein
VAFSAVATGAAAAVVGYWALVPILAVVAALIVAGLIRRASGNAAESATRNWVLVVTPTMLATPAISVPVGAVAISMLAAAAFRPGQLTPLRLGWQGFVLPCVALLIVLRPNSEHAQNKALYFLVACAILIRLVRLSASRTSALVSLADGVGLFSFTSLAMWAVGVTGENTRQGAAAFNSLTNGIRVTFPLSDSLAVSGSMGAIYLVALPLLLQYRQHRLERLIMAGSALAVCVLTDDRTAIVTAVLLGGFVLLIPIFFSRFAPWLVGGSLTVPFVYGPLRGVIDSTLSSLSEVAPWLARSSLRGREEIWPVVLEHFTDRVDWLHQMVGFGVHGQSESGASAFYSNKAALQNFRTDPQFKSPHNAMLQILLDGGWVTAGVISAMMIYLALALRRNLVGLAILTASVLVSTTNVGFSPAHMQPIWWVLVALALIASSSSSSHAVEPIQVAHDVRYEVGSSRRNFTAPREKIKIFAGQELADVTKVTHSSVN